VWLPPNPRQENIRPIFNRHVRQTLEGADRASHSERRPAFNNRSVTARRSRLVGKALQTATTQPARFLERSHSLGTIEVGKTADLVLLDADPLDDIHYTARISAVILMDTLFRLHGTHSRLYNGNTASFPHWCKIADALIEPR
jgi:Amidohydrolase family